jgi:hypothetical protein
MTRNYLAHRAVRQGRTDAIGQRAAEIVAAEDRDRAVIARREGRRILAIGPITRRYNPCANRLPESAFDWPIYRAGMYGYDGEFLATDYELDRRAGDWNDG